MNSETIIKESHKRSKSYGISTEIKNSKKVLSNMEIKNIMTINKDLIEIADSYMKIFFDTIDENEFILILTDSNGCILDIKGHDDIISEFNSLNLKVGAYMDEKNIGTNAMGTALSTNSPIQITAEEHFIGLFKELTCSAAPIHSPDGKIIGALNLTGKWNNHHTHTLALVVYAAKAIENVINKLYIERNLEKSYLYMENIVNGLNKGLLIIDENNVIQKINETANILLKNEKQLIGKDISSVFTNWPKMHKKENDKSVETLVIADLNLKLEIKSIKLEKRIIGTFITLERIERLIFDKTGAKYKFSDIIGASPVIKNVITNCKVVANSQSTILIEGESGTGKEVLAQAIHNYSNRNNSKFVAINCGAIPANIIESELFGYEEGSFTGARKGGKIGKFEVANNGTLFLDEIGEMSLELQVHLLRVLQENKITRLGSDKDIPINVRIIAATNKNLKKEIKEGRFREDLYYRLCVLPIELPPLRDRKGDVEILIKYFLYKKSNTLHKPIPKIESDLYDKLINFNWPGNIRQLENIIENIVNLNGHLSVDIFSNTRDNPLSPSNIPTYKIKEFNLDINEKILISEAIKKCNFNLTKTASILGISRNTLYSKIKKYSIVL